MEVKEIGQWRNNKMDNDVVRKIYLGLIAVTIAVIILEKTGLVNDLFKQQDTSNTSISTSETATDEYSSWDETSETSRRLMYSSTIWSMFR